MSDGRLDAVLTEHIARVDRRVRSGGEVYAAERDEVRRAAARVGRLREELALGSFVASLTPETAKPQFLLLFEVRGGERAVLKVYGRVRPGEALVQRLWQAHGVPTVEVRSSGDAPTSWLLMTPLPAATSADEVLAGRPLDAVALELAAVLQFAHRIGARALDAGRDGSGTHVPLADAVTRHLDAVLPALTDHGYVVPRWRAGVERFCVADEPTLLHGDLTPGNVLRDGPEGGLRLLDACGYLGPAEFDGARWAARTGGARRAREVLDAWLTADDGLVPARARGLLGLECLMQAGVRELVKDERAEPVTFPDTETAALLGLAASLLVGGR